MMTTLCTIVIPAYNAEAWIERTLKSVAQQTYPAIEVLVINDGSKDATRSIAEAMAAVDHRFRVISLENGGVARARNVGIQEARGEYVAFLDADDLWHPDKIRFQVEAIEQPVDGALPAASYTLTRAIDVDDRVTGNGIQLGCSGYILARHLYFKFVGNGSSILVRRNIALELGGYDPSWIAHGMGGCEDLDFELKVAARNTIVCVRQFLVGYRSSPGNMSSNHFSMCRGALGVVRQHIKENPQIPGWARRLIHASTLYWSVQVLISGRHWMEAMKHSLLMFANRPRTFLEVLKRRSGRVVLRVQEEAAEPNSRGRLFAEVSPETDLDALEVGRHRDWKIQEALTELDAELWGKVKQGLTADCQMRTRRRSSLNLQF